MSTHLSSEELLRYDRQIMLPDIGEDGQKRLRHASVFLAGLGGLGSISAFYLAAAGVGHLRAVDKDRVEPGNLNRQLLHSTEDIGRIKATSAGEKLRALNPYCQVEVIHDTITPENGERLVGDADLIVDGTDNVTTRRILNRISLRKGIPFLFGGVDGLSGMTTTFIPGKTACFECLFPDEMKEPEAPGVLGPLPGIIAGIQALVAIKFLVGMSEGLLASRLLYVDGAALSFKIIEMERNPRCGVCGGGLGNGETPQ